MAAMQLLATVIHTLLGVPFFLYLPGLIFDHVWLKTTSLHGVERHVLRIVVSVLLTGWLALLLAEMGLFSFWLLLALLAAVCGLVWLITHRKQAVGRGAPLGIVAGRSAWPARGSLWTALALRGFDYGLLGIALVFGLLVARPFEVVRGGLDAGVYANTGFAIARTGSIVQSDPIIAAIGQRSAAGDWRAAQIETNMLGTQPAKRFLATRVRAAGFFINEGELAQGRVVPQFFHMWPVWIAIFVTMFGPTAGLVATGAAGTLGVLLIGLIGRRVGGTSVGLLAAAFLALMTPQVWFSRMSTSEALAQALILAGLWGYMHFAEAEERREQIWWGALVGGAFGTFALTRIDFFWAVLPALALLLYVALTRRWHAGYAAMAVVLVGLLLHMLVHMLVIARAYFFDTGYARLQDYALTIWLSIPFLSPELQERFMYRWGSKYQQPWRIWIELAVLGIGCLALLALWRWPRPLLMVERWIVRYQRWLTTLVVFVLGIAAVYAYLIRPEIINADVLQQPLRPDNWLRLQGYVGAPIDVPIDKYCDGDVERFNPDQKCKKTAIISLANMVRFGWYLSPLGVVLGVIGGLLLWRRLDRRTWLLVLVATAYIVFYVRLLYGTEEQTYIYILRRFVPMAYPAFALGIAVALAAIKGSKGSRWALARTSVFGILTPSLLLFFVVTGRTVYAHVEYGGALAQIEQLSRQFGPRDIVLVRGGGAENKYVRFTSDLVVTPLTYAFGRNAVPIRGTDPAKYPEAFADQVTRWRDEGRRVFLLLSASGGDLLFPGYAPKPVTDWTLELREFQQLENQKPKLAYTNTVPFKLYELVPVESAVPSMTLDYNDTAAQVAGFYLSESSRPGEPTAAWTNGAGVLRLPSAAQSQRVTLEVAGGVRPQAIGAAQVCVDIVAEPTVYPEGGVANLPWRELTCTTLGDQPSTMPVELPTLETTGDILVRLRSPGWVPAQTKADPGAPQSADTRTLGIRFLRATIHE